MITIDTNILARYLLQDDKQQYTKACTTLQNHHCFVPITVTLELAWVLSSKKIAKNHILNTIKSLIQINTFTFQYQNELISALNWAETSMDIADAIHLAIAQQQHALPIYSFDKRFISKAQQLDKMSNSCQLP